MVKGSGVETDVNPLIHICDLALKLREKNSIFHADRLVWGETKQKKKKTKGISSLTNSITKLLAYLIYE